jgi:hypothetical protein
MDLKSLTADGRVLTCDDLRSIELAVESGIEKVEGSGVANVVTASRTLLLWL